MSPAGAESTADDAGVLGTDWSGHLSDEMSRPYFRDLQEFVARERAAHAVHPAGENVYAAFRETSLAGTKVVILGQDPYHGPGQAHGLCFSVQRGTRVPPSLRNIFRELHDDIGVATPVHGDLTPWARQGVLLLNTSLTVREGQAGSHQRKGWETFTDRVISLVNEKQERTVFVLWGLHARTKRALITNPVHSVLESAHPSPLSARNGFFGSRPFSEVNRALQEENIDPVNWALPVD